MWYGKLVRTYKLSHPENGSWSGWNSKTRWRCRWRWWWATRPSLSLSPLSMSAPRTATPRQSMVVASPMMVADSSSWSLAKTSKVINNCISYKLRYQNNFGFWNTNKRWLALYNAELMYRYIDKFVDNWITTIYRHGQTLTWMWTW